MTLKSQKAKWTRRTFVSTIGLAGAAAAIPGLRAAASPTPKKHVESGLAFVAFSMSGQPDMDRVDVFRLGGSRESMGPTHSAPLVSPSALVLHPALPILYVAHATGLHEHLPCGSLSAHAFDATGVLTKISHEPLSLSATKPGHLTISPDGRTLLISSADGGAYNVFNIDSLGSIQRGPYPLKQTGSGPHPIQRSARPHSAVFSRSGSAAYATDLGADRLNHIAFSEGGPSIQSRVSFAPGSGPAHLALHPSGKFLVVASSLRPVLTVVPIDQESGKLLSPTPDLVVEASALGPIAFSASGRQLFVAATTDPHRETRVASFRLSLATGKLCQTSCENIAQIGSTRHFYGAGEHLHLVGSSGSYAVGSQAVLEVGKSVTTGITGLAMRTA